MNSKHPHFKSNTEHANYETNNVHKKTFVYSEVNQHNPNLVYMLSCGTSIVVGRCALWLSHLALAKMDFEVIWWKYLGHMALLLLVRITQCHVPPFLIYMNHAKWNDTSWHLCDFVLKWHYYTSSTLFLKHCDLHVVRSSVRLVGFLFCGWCTFLGYLGGWLPFLF